MIAYPKGKLNLSMTKGHLFLFDCLPNKTKKKETSMISI
jgi:hypothetical protein